MASTLCAAAAPPDLYLPERRYPPQLGQRAHEVTPAEAPQSWRTGGLTLQNLRLLAESLAPPDLELTPVQAWFELVERYGREALSTEVMDAMKREFVGVVKCIHFGAAMEREAFESVAGRVMGEYDYVASEQVDED